MQNRRNNIDGFYYRSGNPPPVRTISTPKTIKRTHHLRAVVLILLILAAIVGLFYTFSDSGRNFIQTYVVEPVIGLKSSNPPPAPLSTAALATMSNAINTVINNNSDIDMSVSLIDLSDNQAEQYGDNSAFTAASTTKLITAADFLHEVELGQQSLNETVNGHTAVYEIQQMIVISDDEAWDDLNELLGFNQLQAYANSIGLNSFQSVANTVTSNDMATLLEQLYEGQLLNSINTQLLLSYMKQANYRQYIVPAVPSDDTIYHKVGLYEDDVDDEAIIVNGKKAFAIVIFTDGNGIYNWPARAQMMQQITGAALAAYF